METLGNARLGGPVGFPFQLFVRADRDQSRLLYFNLDIIFISRDYFIQILPLGGVIFCLFFLMRYFIPM